MWREYRNDILKITFAAVIFCVLLFVPVEGIPKLVLFLIPYLLVGTEVLISAFKNITKGKIFSESFLMSIATIGAFCLGEYPEAVMVMLLSQIGELFEEMATKKSKASISALLDVRPDMVTVLRDQKKIQVPPQEVFVGETICISPGDRVPIDARILKGTSTLDTALLTGESLPREVEPNDVIYSGSINLSGVIEAKTLCEFSKSTVSKILELTETAAQKKTKSEAFIQRFAKYYTSIVVCLAVLLAIVPPLLFHAPFAEWIRRALTFLVISCPCALVISVPLSFFAGIGGASKAGVLVKGSTNLEALSKVDTVVFDKTGTLTSGSFSVVQVDTVEATEETILQLAASVENSSPHPIAKAICQTAKERNLPLLSAEKITEVSGYGVSACIGDHVILVGSRKLMQQEHIVFQQKDMADTVVHVAMDGVFLGTIHVTDTMKKEAKETIQALRHLGVQKTVLLTGDKQAVCDKVQNALQLDEAYAELLPQDKVDKVEDLLKVQQKNHMLAFIGDGMNDAPALVRADVGVAMGVLGTDAAIEAADVVLMDDNPFHLIHAIRIAKKTMRIVYTNIFFVLLVKFVVLLLGAFGFANLWMAVFADVGVMVLAVCNAMRAMRYKK